MKNYYEILEVNPRASKEVIEKAYRVLVKKYHPDLYIGQERQYAEAKIKDINEAYKILSSEFLKEQYDSELEKENLKKNNIKYESKPEPKNSKQKESEEFSQKMKKHKVGSFAGIIELTKQLIKDLKQSKTKREEIKEVTKKDVLAVGLTIITVIILGIILWFIPFTNGWMRELLIDNPISQWIIGLFS